MNNQIEKPRLIAFEVTRRCKFNCLHCRAGEQTSRKTTELSTSECEKILTSIADFNKCVIILTGGEPMERDDIYGLIRYGRELGLRMVLATCGYTITEDSIAKLKQYGVLSISISLDGASAKVHDAFRQTEGAFDTAINAAKLAKKAGMPFQINTTISKLNIDEVFAISQLAQKLGASCFNPFILVPTGKGREISNEILDPIEYEQLLNNLSLLKTQSPIEVRVTCGPQFSRVYQKARQRKLVGNANGCMGGRGFAFISCQGDVQTCGFLDISAGNLVKNGYDFAQIWQESPFLNEIRNLPGYKGKCALCEYVSTCGGCRARAFALCGDYLASDPICDYKPKSKNR